MVEEKNKHLPTLEEFNKRMDRVEEIYKQNDLITGKYEAREQEDIAKRSTESNHEERIVALEQIHPRGAHSKSP